MFKGSKPLADLAIEIDIKSNAVKDSIMIICLTECIGC